jgi:hypothetical protein
VQLTARDIRALVWCGEMYGIRVDLLAQLLDVSGNVVRKLHAGGGGPGWRTARLGPGPVWCWLTRTGLEACGLPYAAYRPPLGRINRLVIREDAIGKLAALLPRLHETTE